MSTQNFQILDASRDAACDIPASAQAASCETVRKQFVITFAAYRSIGVTSRRINMGVLLSRQRVYHADAA